MYIIYIYIYIHSGVPPGNPRFFLEGAHKPRGRQRVYTAKPDGAPTGNPPPAWEGALHTASPPRPPSAPPKKGTPARRVGDIVPCRAAMNRHGPTPGDTRPPPPSLKRGPRRPPGREQPPPPPLQGTAALGSPRPAPGGLSGFAPEPAQPFHAPPLTSRSPWARPVSPAPVHNHQGPGPRSPGAQPRPPPRYPSGGARPGPVRPRGDGEALPPPPPGFAPVDDARRDSSPPSGVRAPPLTAAPRLRERPGLPGRLWPAPTAPLPRSAAR